MVGILADADSQDNSLFAIPLEDQTEGDPVTGSHEFVIEVDESIE